MQLSAAQKRTEKAVRTAWVPNLKYVIPSAAKRLLAKATAPEVKVEMPVRTMPIGDGSSTHCKSDKDCPSSYCMRDPTKKAPYMCKDCGPNCCNSNADCP